MANDCLIFLWKFLKENISLEVPFLWNMYSITILGNQLPSWWSDVLQASMKVCATTERHESTIFALPRSNTKLGFFIRLTQNLVSKKINGKFFLKSFFTWEEENLISRYAQLLSQWCHAVRPGHPKSQTNTEIKKQY